MGYDGYHYSRDPDIPPWTYSPPGHFPSRTIPPPFLHGVGHSPYHHQHGGTLVSEMTYNVSSGTLNSTIPYHGGTKQWSSDLLLTSTKLIAVDRFRSTG